MQAARIAIVDDDPLFVEYLATFLKSRGYETVVFNNGPALLGALQGRSAPDVVLLDVLMPTMNGLETLKALKTANPSLPVIMLSGQQVPATIVDAVRLGAVDYVVKSDESAALHDAALEAAINRALEHTSLTSEVARLTAQIAESPDGAQVCWGTGPSMRNVLTMIDRVSDSDVSVLLSGESGVGKEVIARELHRRSARRTKPFVKVNCAALPSELLESELFGHERGAFTGAQATRVGKFEFASSGTILLDEIGEMPVGLQAKLLHVLQDRAFTKLGSNRPVEIDVRVIAATNRDLATMIRNGQFREDLYYRLQVIEIRVPALRNRREEIPTLVEFFLRRYADRYGRPLLKPSPALVSTRASGSRSSHASPIGRSSRSCRPSRRRRRSRPPKWPRGRLRRPSRCPPATVRRPMPPARLRSSRIWRVPRRFPPSAKPSSTRSITSAGIAGRPPRSWASATRRC